MGIETGWGELSVNDAHVHFFSHKFLTALAGQRKDLTVASAGELLGWSLPPEDPLGLATSWAAELDRHGVGRAALIASVPGDVSSVSEAVAAYPARFVGHFMFDPTRADADPKDAFDRGLRCVCLFPALHHYSILDPRARPILDVASEKPGCVVFVHCGTLSIGVRKRLGLATVYDARFANPLDLMAVAQAYPSIPFVIPHFGAGLLREALLVASQCPNVMLDTSSSNAWMAVEDLDLRTVFRRALAVVGPDRLLFGTDSSWFPRGWNKAVFDAQAKALYELGLDAETAGKIFSGNFERLFPVLTHP